MKVNTNPSRITVTSNYNNLKTNGTPKIDPYTKQRLAFTFTKIHYTRLTNNIRLNKLYNVVHTNPTQNSTNTEN